MKPVKKISVIGAGALGTLVGAFIKRYRPDLDVMLICRGPHLKALQERGYAELRGSWGSYQIPIAASNQPEAIADSDLVLFTVKTQDTEATAKQYVDLVGEATIVSLQNGINQRVLRNYFRNDRLLVGMTATNMTTIEPGVVYLHRDGVSAIGPALPEVPASVAQQALEALSWSRLTFKLSDHILGIQYNKLLFNTMGYASALAAIDLIREGILYRPWRKNLAIPLIEEGMRVLRGADIQLQKAPGGSDVIRLRRLMHVLNTPGLDTLVRSVSGLFNPPRLVFSVTHDIAKGRPTEIDYVNGEIVTLANQSGQSAPYNTAVVEAVKSLEARDDRTFFTRDEIVERFRQLRE